MREKRENLIKAIKLWLEKNDLTTDTTFYSIEDWKEREEEYHNDSDFVITTEGGLFHILNFGSVNQQTEFEDLVYSFGFIYELGHSWNIGFYFENDEISPNKKTYIEKLKDQKWIDKREYVKSEAEYKCQDCGSTNSLEVHHCFYQFGREPWEYSLDSLRCLCRNCHERRGELEIILRAKFADLTFDELNIFRKLISDSVLAFNRIAFFEFLNSLGSDHEIMNQKFSDLKEINRF